MMFSWMVDPARLNLFMYANFPDFSLNRRENITFLQLRLLLECFLVFHYVSSDIYLTDQIRL